MEQMDLALGFPHWKVANVILPGTLEVLFTQPIKTDNILDNVRDLAAKLASPYYLSSSPWGDQYSIC